MAAIGKVVTHYPPGPPDTWTTTGFLDALMITHNVKTDYGLHKLLKVSRQTIYRYRANAGTFDDEIAIRVGELLKIDPPELMLVYTAAQRARLKAAREWWQKIAKQIAATAAVLVVALLIGAGAQLEDRAALALLTVSDGAQSLYIMSNAILLILMALAALSAIRDRSHGLPRLSGTP